MNHKYKRWIFMVYIIIIIIKNKILYSHWLSRDESEFMVISSQGPIWAKSSSSHRQEQEGSWYAKKPPSPGRYFDPSL